MAVQNTYAREHGVAYPGLRADMNPFTAVSKVNAEATDSIAYGKGVVTDGDDGAVLPSTGAAANSIIGVVMRELNRVTETDGTFAAPIDKDMTVISHGIVWVLAADTVARDDDAFLRVGSTNLGDFANAAGAGVTESVQIAGAKFLTGGNAGDLVKLSLGVGG